MPKMTFYPLGNADCCLLDLDDKQKLLFDYANTRCADDPDDLRIDLPDALRGDLKAANRNYYDVVAFSHLDKDHFGGASAFFYLEHSSQYQSEDRVKIDILWVPASVIIEPKDTLSDEEARIIQAEARYRLRNRKGIRVFSHPGLLVDWLKEQGMTLDDVRHLITDAGQLVPGFTKDEHGVEFFVHSPFAKRINECEVVNRNHDSLVLQATFSCNSCETKLILSADVNHEVLSDIVEVTKWHAREERLEWDVFKLPHHCSYTSLGPDKGEDVTVPVPNVKWLFEEQGRRRGIIVSTSKPIPSDDSDPQPPHRQAANYHQANLLKLNGEFKVTMEHPTKIRPEPLVISIDSFGARIEKRNTGGSIGVVSSPAPRAGAADE